MTLYHCKVCAAVCYDYDICSPCANKVVENRKAYMKKYREDNREKLIANSKKWAKDNVEKHRAQSLKSYHKRKEIL